MKNTTASLSFDLDDKWSYMMTHGDAGWESFPSYLHIIVPRVLKFLKERNLTITFFIVGQDAALPKNKELLKSIAEAGHEIGNHSFKHEPWLHLHSEDVIKKDICLAEEHIERVTGEKPIGFRGPGYSLNKAILEELIRRNYQYDASTIPTFVFPLLRAFYFKKVKLTSEERRRRKAVGGQFRDVFRPNRPYKWQTEFGTIIELPVTTMPFIKIPIHISHLLGLYSVSKVIAKLYFNLGLKLYHLNRIQPSIILHPTDFLGSDDNQGLAYFPVMNISHEEKMEIVADFITRFCEHFNIVTLRQHVLAISQIPSLSLVMPKFSH